MASNNRPVPRFSYPADERQIKGHKQYGNKFMALEHLPVLKNNNLEFGPSWIFDLRISILNLSFSAGQFLFLSYDKPHMFQH